MGGLQVQREARGWGVVARVVVVAASASAFSVLQPPDALRPKLARSRRVWQVEPCVGWLGERGSGLRAAAESGEAVGATETGRQLAERLKGVNLYLVGAMGSGKSSVGDAVCRMLGSYTYLDTDAMIESVTNRSIPEIFQADGEDGFRAAESSVLEQVAAFVRLVVSTGGGLVVKQQNWASLRNGVVVWLDPTIDVLATRLNADELAKRPLLDGADDPVETLSAIIDERRQYYQQADVTVAVADPAETPVATAERVVLDVLRFIADNPPKQPPPA